MIDKVSRAGKYHLLGRLICFYYYLISPPGEKNNVFGKFCHLSEVTTVPSHCRLARIMFTACLY